MQSGSSIHSLSLVSDPNTNSNNAFFLQNLANDISYAYIQEQLQGGRKVKILEDSILRCTEEKSLSEWCSDVYDKLYYWIFDDGVSSSADGTSADVASASMAATAIASTAIPLNQSAMTQKVRQIYTNYLDKKTFSPHSRTLQNIYKDFEAMSNDGILTTVSTEIDLLVEKVRTLNSDFKMALQYLNEVEFHRSYKTNVALQIVPYFRGILITSPPVSRHALSETMHDLYSDFLLHFKNRILRLIADNVSFYVLLRKSITQQVNTLYESVCMPMPVSVAVSKPTSTSPQASPQVSPQTPEAPPHTQITRIFDGFYIWLDNISILCQTQRNAIFHLEKTNIAKKVHSIISS